MRVRRASAIRPRKRLSPHPPRSRGAPPSPAVQERGQFGLGWFGRLSYELYLFHLIVLGLLRTAWPPRAMQGDVKLLLLAAFLLLSAGLAYGIAHFFAEPLNRRLRAGAAPPAGEGTLTMP